MEQLWNSCGTNKTVVDGGWVGTGLYTDVNAWNAREETMHGGSSVGFYGMFLISRYVQCTPGWQILLVKQIDVFFNVLIVWWLIVFSGGSYMFTCSL